MATTGADSCSGCVVVGSRVDIGTATEVKADTVAAFAVREGLVSANVFVATTELSEFGPGCITLASGLCFNELSGVDDRAVVLALNGVVSPVGEFELICAPPLLCTMPDLGSTVEVLSVDDAELAPVLDEVVDEPAGSDVDDSDVDELAVELDELDDELDVEFDDEEPESADGSATATHGVVATAVPIPSATASAPTRPMYFAESIA